MRANSAAMRPRLRTILRIVSLPCASVHSGNAKRRLRSAVLRNFGRARKSSSTTPVASAVAARRGSAPTVLSTIRAAAYASQSFISVSAARFRRASVCILGAPGWKSEVRLMLDSISRDRREFIQLANYFSECRRKNRLDHSHRRHALRLLLQPSWRHRFCGSGRAALRVDCARHGGDRRLGHAASLRKALVRRTAALLLGCGNQLQTFWSQRSRSPLAERHLRAPCDVSPGVAGLAHVRRGDRAVAPAPAADNRRYDRLFARGGNGHAVQ